MKLIIQQKNGTTPSAEMVDEIYKECVSDKIKQEVSAKPTVKKTINADVTNLTMMKSY